MSTTTIMPRTVATVVVATSMGPSRKKPRPSPPISAAKIREEFPHHDPAVARINNGSCPASVLATQLWWQRCFLRQPDDFNFNRLQPTLFDSRAVIKDLINADDVDEVSLVDNTTTAAAIVLQHVSWAFSEGHFNKGDVVVMLHYAYGLLQHISSGRSCKMGSFIRSYEIGADRTASIKRL